LTGRLNVRSVTEPSALVYRSERAEDRSASRSLVFASKPGSLTAVVLVLVVASCTWYGASVSGAGVGARPAPPFAVVSAVLAGSLPPPGPLCCCGTSGVDCAQARGPLRQPGPQPRDRQLRVANGAHRSGDRQPEDDRRADSNPTQDTAHDRLLPHDQ